MLHTRRILSAAAIATLMSAAALPAFAQTTAVPTSPQPTTSTNGKEPAPAKTARGAEIGAQSTTVQGGPAGALGTANSGITTVPGSAPSGGTMHSGG
jgi:hypothetical protein